MLILFQKQLFFLQQLLVLFHQILSEQDTLLEDGIQASLEPEHNLQQPQPYQQISQCMLNGHL